MKRALQSLSVVVAPSATPASKPGAAHAVNPAGLLTLVALRNSQRAQDRPAKFNAGPARKTDGAARPRSARRSANSVFSGLFLLAASHPLCVLAADVSGARLETPSVAFSLFRVVGALALVFALFLGGAWLFRNWQRLTVQRGRAPKLNVLEVKSLGPRHALYVIGYEQQRFLLSSAPTGIAMLTSLPAAAAGEPASPSLPQPTFAETLTQALSLRVGHRGGGR